MKEIDAYIIEKLHISNGMNVHDIDKNVDDPTTWRVGDILVRSGGYSMVLVDFYKIIKATGKSFVVKELKKKNVSGNGWQGECVPIEDEFERPAPDISIRINKYNSVKIEGYHATLWDGKPVWYDHMD